MAASIEIVQEGFIRKALRTGFGVSWCRAQVSCSVAVYYIACVEIAMTMSRDNGQILTRPSRFCPRDFEELVTSRTVFAKLVILTGHQFPMENIVIIMGLTVARKGQVCSQHKITN